MNTYKPVESSELDKDFEIIRPCLNFHKAHNCCKGVFDFIINKKYDFVQVNKKDLDSDCIKNCGKSNAQKCVYFNEDVYSVWRA